jgi:hypothetical protein
MHFATPEVVGATILVSAELEDYRTPVFIFVILLFTFIDRLVVGKCLHVVASWFFQTAAARQR